MSKVSLRTQLNARMRAQGYWTVEDLSTKVCMSKSGIYKWIDEQRVRSTRIGNAVFVELDSVITHLGPEAAALLGIVKP